MSSRRKKKNRQLETMTITRIGPFRIRVWTTVKAFTMGPDDRVFEALRKLPKITARVIAERLDKISGVAAYEILDHAGNGAIVYPDWY